MSPFVHMPSVAAALAGHDGLSSLKHSKAGDLAADQPHGPYGKECAVRQRISVHAAGQLRGHALYDRKPVGPALHTDSVMALKGTVSWANQTTGLCLHHCFHLCFHQTLQQTCHRGEKRQIDHLQSVGSNNSQSCSCCHTCQAVTCGNESVMCVCHSLPFLNRLARYTLQQHTSVGLHDEHSVDALLSYPVTRIQQIKISVKKQTPLVTHVSSRL